MPGPGRPFRSGNPDISKYGWKPGQSGNPGGRPKAVRVLILLARESMPDAIRYADSLFRDENASHKERMDAVRFLAAYGMGAPPKVIDESDEAAADPVDSLTIEELQALARRQLSSEAPAVAEPAHLDVDPSKH